MGEEETVGSTANREESSAPVNTEDTNMTDTAVSKGDENHTDTVEASKDHGDDGGEELVGEEDTVIY